MKDSVLERTLTLLKDHALAEAVLSCVTHDDFLAVYPALADIPGGLLSLTLNPHLLSYPDIMARMVKDEDDAGHKLCVTFYSQLPDALLKRIFLTRKHEDDVRWVIQLTLNTELLARYRYGLTSPQHVHYWLLNPDVPKDSIVDYLRNEGSDLIFLSEWKRAKSSTVWRDAITVYPQNTLDAFVDSGAPKLGQILYDAQYNPDGMGKFFSHLQPKEYGLIVDLISRKTGTDRAYALKCAEFFLLHLGLLSVEMVGQLPDEMVFSLTAKHLAATGNANVVKKLESVNHFEEAQR